MHAYLVIARVSVQEAQNFVSSRPIYQAVNVWKGIGILRTCTVDVSVVDAHPLVAIRLGEHDDIDNQVVYRASLMNSTDRSFSTSSFAARRFSSLRSLFFWKIGRAFLNIDIRWVMTSGLTPGMSAGVQANMSIFFFSPTCMISASTAAMAVPTAVLCSSSRRGTLHSSSLASSLSLAARGSRSTNATVGSTVLDQSFLGE